MLSNLRQDKIPELLMEDGSEKVIKPAKIFKVSKACWFYPRNGQKEKVLF